MKKPFILILSLFAAAYLPAQHQQHRHHQPDPKMAEEMHEFIQNEMVPVLAEKKAALEAELSRKDRKFLEEKRTEATKLREEMKAKHHEMRGKKKGEKPSETEREQHRAERKAMHEKITQFRESMTPFAERNDALLTKAVQDLEPLYDEWTETQKEIVAKYRDEDAKGKGRHHHGMKEGENKAYGLFGIAGPKNHKPHKRMHGKRGHADNKAEGEKAYEHPYPETRLAVQLLLWDGNAPSHDRGLKNEKGEKMGEFQLNSVPNPANETAKLSFMLDTPAKSVRLLLTDQAGQTVKEWTWNELGVGTQEVNLDVSNLRAGVYFYTVEVDGVASTKRLVVQ